MHCVFNAINDNLKYIGIEALYDDWLIYEGARKIADNQGYTSICIVPFIAVSIALRHDILVEIEYVEPFNVKWHRDQATPNEKLLVLPVAPIYKIKQKEAIYFPKFNMHAQFLLKEPKDYIMRITFKEKNNDRATNFCGSATDSSGISATI